MPRNTPGESAAASGAVDAGFTNVKHPVHGVRDEARAHDCDENRRARGAHDVFTHLHHRVTRDGRRTVRARHTAQKATHAPSDGPTKHKLPIFAVECQAIVVHGQHEEFLGLFPPVCARLDLFARLHVGCVHAPCVAITVTGSRRYRRRTLATSTLSRDVPERPRAFAHEHRDQRRKRQLQIRRRHPLQRERPQRHARRLTR